MRAKTDFFPTPEEAIVSLLDLGLIKDHSRILEPSAGDGSILTHLLGYCPGSHITAVEVREEMRGSLEGRCHELIIDNFANYDPMRRFDYVIGNPPYSQLETFIKHSHELLKPGGSMAFLLRLTLLTGIQRFELMQQYPPTTVYLLSKRPKFDGGPAMSGFVWAIWDNPLTTEPTTLQWLAP